MNEATRKDEQASSDGTADGRVPAEVLFAGVAILISEEKRQQPQPLSIPAAAPPEIPTYTPPDSSAQPAPPVPSWFEGEVALLAVSPDHATPEEVENAGIHNPVLVIRRAHVQSVEGVLPESPMEGTVRPEWFRRHEGEEVCLNDFVAWPLSHSVVWPLGVDQRVITFVTPGVEFKSLDFVPSLNVFHPGLTLSRAWRNSPHVTTRFLLSSGEVGSDVPLQPNMKYLLFTYGHQSRDMRRKYSDVIRYRPKTQPTGFVIDSRDSRTTIRFSDTIDKIWILNLDDPSRSDPTYDHFILYGLLPWNFTIPRIESGEPFTGGDCASGRYHRSLNS